MADSALTWPLAAILRGGVAHPRAASYGPGELLAAAVEHDVVPLVADRLEKHGAPPGGPLETIAPRLRAAAREAAAADLAREVELRAVLRAFERAALPVLLVKGSHLAYTHYERPDLRSRLDTDLLVDSSRSAEADAVLHHELGYETDPKLSGELTATQALYVKRRHDADVHLVDLHWRLASPQTFAHALSFEELFATSVEVPALGSWARVPADVHALVIACVHQVAHHHDEDEQLKWVYDVHVVASLFDVAQWDDFVAMARTRRIAAVCLAGLQRSAYWFHTAVPEGVSARLEAAAAWPEETASYLRAGSKAGLLLEDLRALRSWRDRARLAGEHMFPQAEYMRRVYAPSSGLPLPLLYVLRVARGSWKWLGFSRP